MTDFKVGDLVVPSEDLLNIPSDWYRDFNFLGRIEDVIVKANSAEVVVDWFKRPPRGPKRGRYMATSIQHADVVTRIGDLDVT